ncbi:MAG: hypothetical protein ACXACU_05975 [Candidatus Hodarchaeales archaeon]
MNTDKFPFKWMPDMIELLEKKSNERIKSFKIARAIGSCVSDTNETARMLNYLTHFGKITLNQNGNYSIEYKANTELSLKGFRVKYIIKLVEIIKVLSKEELNIEQLSKTLNRKCVEVKTDLEFLEAITSKGQVFLEGSKYLPKIYFEHWVESRV